MGGRADWGREGSEGFTDGINGDGLRFGDDGRDPDGRLGDRGLFGMAGRLAADRGDVLSRHCPRAGLGSSHGRRYSFGGHRRENMILRGIASLALLGLLALNVMLPSTSIGRRGTEAVARTDVESQIVLGKSLPELELLGADGAGLLESGFARPARSDHL